MIRSGILIVVVAIIIVAIGMVQFLRERKRKRAKRPEKDPKYFSVLLDYQQNDGSWSGRFYRHGTLCYAEVFGIPEGCECAGLRVWALNVGFAERYLMEAKEFGPPRYCCGHEGVILSHFDVSQKGWLCEYYKNGLSFCGIVFGFSEKDKLEGCSVNVVRAPELGTEAFRRMI